MKAPSRLERASNLRNDIVTLTRRLKQSAGADAETWTSLMVLGAIERAGGGATPTQVATEFDLKSSNLAQVLGGLARRNLIERTPDPVDKRRIRLSLTEEGSVLIQEARARRTRWLLEAMDARLSAAEQDELMGLMRRLAAHAQGAPESE